MITISMQYFGNNGAASGKSGGAGGGGSSGTQAQALKNETILKTPGDFSTLEVEKALNSTAYVSSAPGFKGLTFLGEKAADSLRDNFPKGALIMVKSNDGFITSFTKTGKDTWTQIIQSKYKDKLSTGSLLYTYHNGANHITVGKINNK